MSVGYASSKNVIGNSNREIPLFDIPPTAAPETWVRPADWLTLPTVSLGDNIFVGLWAVYDTTQNYCSVIVSGAYTVDWGDGTVEDIASGVRATHLYDYSTISSGTLTSRGYKQVIVTITPQAGQSLTSIDVTPVSSTRYNVKWLDASVSSTNLATFDITTTANNLLLEQFKVYSFGASWQPSSLCANLIGLKNFEIYGDTSTKTNFSSMFSNCFNLQSVPLFDTSSATNFASMFNNCYSLLEVPLYNSSNVTSMNNMFGGCNSITTVPLFDASSATNMASMFITCFALENVPAFNTPNVTNMSAMFMQCYSLKYVPYMNTSKVTNLGSFVNSCYTITEFPNIDTSKVTDMSLLCENARSLTYMPPLSMEKVTTIQSAFNGCYALEANDIGKYSGAPLLSSTSAISQLHWNCYSLVKAPDFSTWNTNACVNINNIFINCSSLQYVEPFYTPNVTTMYNIFSGCTSLIECPAFPSTSNVANTSAMFANCYSLTTIPSSVDFPNNTNAASMFSNCKSLAHGPELTTTKVTNTASMFVNCSGLLDIPTYDTANVTNMSLMFQGCSSLNSVPLLDTSKVTTINSIYSSCGALQSAPNLNTANVTNMNSMYYSSGVTIIPAHNFSSVNTATTNFVNTGGSPVQRMNFTGLKLSLNISGASLGSVELDEVMTNLGANNTSQTLTITSNPGSLITYTSTLTAGQAVGSTTLTVGSSSGYQIGELAYNTVCFAPAAVTLQSSTDTVTRNNHGLADGTRVSFATLVTATGVSINTIYYVVNSTTNTFQVSLTLGGSPIDITTSGSGTLRFEVYVVDKPTSTTVTVSAPTTATTTATVLTCRPINTYLASLKNWTITG